MVVPSFRRGDVDVVAAGSRHFSRLLERSFGGLPAMDKFAMLAHCFYREAHFFFLFSFFLMISAWILKAFASVLIWLATIRVGRIHRNPLCGSCLLSDSFGHLHRMGNFLIFTRFRSGTFSFGCRKTSFTVAPWRFGNSTSISSLAKPLSGFMDRLPWCSERFRSSCSKKQIAIRPTQLLGWPPSVPLDENAVGALLAARKSWDPEVLMFGDGKAVRSAYLDGETDGPRSYAAIAWVVRGAVP